MSGAIPVQENGELQVEKIFAIGFPIIGLLARAMTLRVPATKERSLPISPPTAPSPVPRGLPFQIMSKKVTS